MQYLIRQGDILETAQVDSVCIFNNWMQDKPKFCFVVPTYKRSKLLNYALLSILSLKGLSDYEILVIDDFPERNDETECLMSQKYDLPQLAYYKNTKNLGQPGNWNKCFLLSRAEWIIMLQDDDMLYSDFFITLRKAMNLYGKNVGGYFPGVLRHTFSDGTMPVQPQGRITAKVIKLCDFLQGNVMGAGALGMTLQRDLVMNIGGVNINAGPAVDYDFYNRFARVTDLVKLYGRPLGVWRTMVNVSQKEETVFFCLNWGNQIMMDTLECLHLSWLRLFYKKYLMAYGLQHYLNWCKEMNQEISFLPMIDRPSKIDKWFYIVFRIFFVVRRRIRAGKGIV